MFGRGLKEQYEKRIDELHNQYEARISQLHAQIQDLQKLVFAPRPPIGSTLISLEQDAILSQKEEVIEVTAEAYSEADRQEADRILSGNYDISQYV